MACFHFLQENDDENDFLPLRSKNSDLIRVAQLSDPRFAILAGA